MDSNTVLYLAFAQIMQLTRPLPVLRQVPSDPLREKNVIDVAAIHHPLRYINAGAGKVSVAVNINDFADGPAVNPHAH